MGKEHVRWVACGRCGAGRPADAGRCLRCGAAAPPLDLNASRFSLNGLMLAMAPIAVALAAFRLHEFAGVFAMSLVVAALLRTRIELGEQKKRTGRSTSADAAVFFLGSLAFMAVAFAAVIPSAGSVLVAVICLRATLAGELTSEFAWFAVPFAGACLVLSVWLLLVFLRHRRTWAHRAPFLQSLRTRSRLREEAACVETSDDEQPAASQLPENAQGALEARDSGLLETTVTLASEPDVLTRGDTSEGVEPLPEACLTRDLALGPNSPARRRPSLATLLLGIVPIALIFTAARIPLALDVAVIVLLLSAFHRREYLRERMAGGPAPRANSVVRFLGLLGWPLRFTVALAVALAPVLLAAVCFIECVINGYLRPSAAADAVLARVGAALVCVSIPWLTVTIPLLVLYHKRERARLRGHVPGSKCEERSP